MTAERSPENLQHLEAVLNEIEMLHDRITHLEMTFTEAAKKVKDAAAAAVALAKVGVNKGKQKYNDLVHKPQTGHTTQVIENTPPVNHTAQASDKSGIINSIIGVYGMYIKSNIPSTGSTEYVLSFHDEKHGDAYNKNDFLELLRGQFDKQIHGNFTITSHGKDYVLTVTHTTTNSPANIMAYSNTIQRQLTASAKMY
jgi:hypothetical protein